MIFHWGEGKKEKKQLFLRLANEIFHFFSGPCFSRRVKNTFSNVSKRFVHKNDDDPLWIWNVCDSSNSRVARKSEWELESDPGREVWGLFVFNRIFIASIDFEREIASVFFSAPASRRGCRILENNLIELWRSLRSYFVGKWVHVALVERDVKIEIMVR